MVKKNRCPDNFVPFLVTISAFVTEGSKRKQIDISDIVKMNVQLVSPKKGAVVLLDRLTKSQIEAACNPSKPMANTVEADPIRTVRGNIFI